MILKWIFDRVVALIGLLFLWPVLLVTAVLIKIKMPGGPAFFVQKRVGRNGKLFKCHKFRSMKVAPVAQVENSLKSSNGLKGNSSNSSNPSNSSTAASPSNSSNPSNPSNSTSWSSVSVAGDSRITPFGAKLRHWKLDELPELWDVLIGNMSFVGPRPDVPGYADKLEGDDRDVLKLRPGITGPATLKYRLEDEQIAAFVASVRSASSKTKTLKTPEGSVSNEASEIVSVLPSSASSSSIDSNAVLSDPSGKKQEINHSDDNPLNLSNLSNLPEGYEEMTDQELAVWYNDTVIYPDKVRLNCYYYRHYSFWKDIEMIFATVLGRKVKFGGERF